MLRLALFLVILLAPEVDAQQRQTVRGGNQVPCWFVGNGSNVTMQCANGYWHTIDGDGNVIDGNGMTDPNASAAGSTFRIDPKTGGPVTNSNGGPSVTGPTQQLPMLAPHQAEQYGFQPRLD